MTAARNVAIVALLALALVALPGGGNAADALVAAISLGFLAAIVSLAYSLYRENHMSLLAMSDTTRALFYGAFGAIALLIVGADKLLDTGAGTVAFLALMGLSIFAIVRIWIETRRYA